MKKLILILSLGFALTSNAQSYDFSKSNGAYFNLSGATVIRNDNWVDFGTPIKLPFQFKLYGDVLQDSLYFDDLGSLSIDDTYDGEITFLGEDLKSRGTGKSPISYMVEGTTPNRIFKIELRNTGFELNTTGLKDSANVQCWLYETSNIIEFRYGPNMVSVSSWFKNGAFVNLYSTNHAKFVYVEGDPLNPTLNKTNEANAKPLNGMPINGTIYKFTPSTGGINEPVVKKITIIQNKISLPASVEVKSIRIYNSSGQVVQSASKVDETDLTKLIHGIYFIVINTADGIITEKKFL